jgi:signal transduction histidine kinase
MMAGPLFASVFVVLLAGRQLARRRKDPACFLATVSHELRTPLNAIMGWVNLLKSGRLTAADTAHAFDCIERNIRLEVELIEELLDASQLLGGRAVVVAAPVNFAEVVASAVARLGPTACNKRVRLIADLPASPIIVSGDERRLGGAVWQLLVNAVKFTPAGGEVLVKLDERGDRVHLRVEDTGEGIAPEDLPHVFEPFLQGRTGGRREGLGLGLAVVRQSVELHHGSVSAESAGAGYGSVFSVTLPVVRKATGGENKGQEET